MRRNVLFLASNATPAALAERALNAYGSQQFRAWSALARGDITATPPNEPDVATPPHFDQALRHVGPNLQPLPPNFDVVIVLDAPQRTDAVSAARKHHATQLANANAIQHWTLPPAATPPTSPRASATTSSPPCKSASPVPRRPPP